LGAGTTAGASAGTSLSWVASKADGNSSRPMGTGASLALPAPGTRRGRGAFRSAGGADAWACALSRAARLRCRSESDSTGLANGPVPGPRFAPGTRRGSGMPPWSSATPTLLGACATARLSQDSRAQNGLPFNTNRSTHDQLDLVLLIHYLAHAGTAG